MRSIKQVRKQAERIIGKISKKKLLFAQLNQLKEINLTNQKILNELYAIIRKMDGREK